MLHPLLVLAAAAMAGPVAAGAPPATGSTGKGAVPALYATRAEAEKAAKLHFHCSGAHPMGHQWMPCAEHGAAPGAHH
jgi:hypothetical protein